MYLKKIIKIILKVIVLRMILLFCRTKVIKSSLSECNGKIWIQSYYYRHYVNNIEKKEQGILENKTF